MLQVSDTGEGITENELPNLFQRFYRIEGTRSRTHEGSGIGLAFVQELVKLHGGSIRAESRIGEGTTFTVSIPTGSAHLPADKLSVTAEAPQIHNAGVFIEEASGWLTNSDFQQLLPEGVTAGGHTEQSALILVVDDNSDMRAYVARILGEIPGWRINTAVNGLDAMQKARNEKPDLILSDVMMPDMNGFELLAELRTDERLKRIPVVLLSARAGEEATLEGLEKGADDYLVKPFSARELVARVRTQLEITHSRQDLTALKEAEERARMAIDASEQGTFELDLHAGRFIASPKMAGIFEMQNDADHNRYVTAFLEEDRSVREEAYKQAYRNGELDYEGRIKRRDGGIRWIKVKGRVYFDNEQQPARVLGVVRDITIEKEAERQKDDFISIASHELKTPVTALKASLQLLNRMKEEPNKMLPVFVEQANKSMDKVTVLIEGLLNASKVSQGILQIEKSNFVISRVLEECCGHIRSEGEYRIVPTGDLNLSVYADIERIDQVLINLINNAVKYAPQSKEILVHIESIPGFAKVSVTDRGPGISPDKLEKLFDRYFRVKSDGNQASGLGLGLYICNEIIKKQGGQMGVSSRLGEGSAFWFTLPL